MYTKRGIFDSFISDLLEEIVDELEKETKAQETKVNGAKKELDKVNDNFWSLIDKFSREEREKEKEVKNDWTDDPWMKWVKSIADEYKAKGADVEYQATLQRKNDNGEWETVAEYNSPTELTEREPEVLKLPEPVKRIFINPAKATTTIKWTDDTTTTVRCTEEDKFDLEKAIAICFMKRALGNKSFYNSHMIPYIKGAEIQE